MKSKRYKYSQSQSSNQILNKVKREMTRDRQFKKVQQTMIYLQNSFDNNIQFQEIYIDLCKGKKKNLRSKDLKLLYSIFSENKANECIFQKIYKTELQRLKQVKLGGQSTFSKWAKNSKGFMQVIEQQQSESQKQIKISDNGEQINNSPSKLNKKESLNDEQQANQQMQKQVGLLIRRIYCRIVQKILVKIAFYSMNNRFLDFIAPNILEISKNLETIIRRLANIKDLRLLQHIIMKVYQENQIIEDKIYQVLVDKGYVLSLDEFYRINGIDLVHKDVFERNGDDEDSFKPSLTSLKMDFKQNLRQKINRMKQKRQKANVVKKQHIDRTNKEITQKYVACISQMQDLVQQQQKVQQKQSQKPQQNHEERNSVRFSQTVKTNISPRKKPSRFSKIFQLNEINVGETTSSQDGASPRQSLEFIRKSNSKLKPLYPLSKRFSTFSNQFVMLIKASPQGATKIQRNSHTLSQRFLQFNQFDKKRRSKNSRSDISDSSKDLQKYKSLKKVRKNDSFAINKLLKLYESKNTNRFSVDDYLGTNLRLPRHLGQNMKEQLLKLLSVQELKGQNQVDAQPEDDKPSNSNHTRQRWKQPKTRFSEHISKVRNHFDFGSFQQKKSIDQNSDHSVQIPSVDNQIQMLQSHKQFAIAKMENYRQMVNMRDDKISSANCSIFTSHGMKNLNDKKIIKPQKLKRIAYHQTKTSQTKENQHDSRCKIARKAYENLQVDDSQTFDKLRKDKMKLMALQPIPTKEVCKKYATFHSRFQVFRNNIMQKDAHFNESHHFKALDPFCFRNGLQKPEKLKPSVSFQNKKRFNTTHLNHTQPVSPRKNSLDTKQLTNRIEVFDNRRRIKITKFI